MKSNQKSANLKFVSLAYMLLQQILVVILRKAPLFFSPIHSYICVPTVSFISVTPKAANKPKPEEKVSKDTYTPVKDTQYGRKTGKGIERAQRYLI